jgi:putative membrane protein
MKMVLRFVAKLAVNALGLWLAMRLLSGGEFDITDFSSRFGVFLLAAFMLALVNMFIKPVVFILSLPVTILTLGLFTVVINGLMVYLALLLTPGLSITFGGAIIAGIIIGIVNFAVNKLLEVADSK